MARDFRRQLGSAQNFTPNSPVSFDLPRDSVYKEINVGLILQFTTGVGGALSGPFDGAPWTLIKRIELIADGKDTIKSMDGAMLADLNQMDYHAYPQTPTLALGASADTGVWRLATTIALESVGMEFPQHTWLDARKLSSLELRVTFGNNGVTGSNDVFATATAPFTFVSYSITPYGHEILDISDKSTFSVNQEVMTSFAFPTTSAVQRDFRLNVGNAYRRILISTKDQNARAAVERLQTINLIQNGVFNRRSWDAGWLKQKNSQINQLAVGLGIGSAPAALPAISATGRNGGHRTGVFELDIAENGTEEALLDTKGFSDLKLSLDWDGANTTDLIRFCPSIWIPSIR